MYGKHIIRLVPSRRLIHRCPAFFQQGSTPSQQGNVTVNQTPSGSNNSDAQQRQQERKDQQMTSQRDQDSSVQQRRGGSNAGEFGFPLDPFFRPNFFFDDIERTFFQDPFFRNTFGDVAPWNFGGRPQQGRGGQLQQTAQQQRFQPIALDIKEYPDRYEIHADIPGVPKEEIKVDYDRDRGTLTLKAETKFERETKKPEGAKDEKEVTYHTIERRYGVQQRVIRIPDRINEGSIKAEYKDGVLRMSLPKAKPEEKQSIKID